jgi:ankyrin repeat protein
MRLFRPYEEPPPDDSSLVEAVERGDAAAVRERLAAGAFVDSCGPTGHSALMLAATVGDREIFELLLAAGADPYLRHSGSGPTALDEAAGMGQSEIVEVWLQRGLDVRLADSVGNTPLMAAAAGHVELVRRLLAAGADVHARTVDGITAYSVARHERHDDVVAVLRQAGASSDPDDPLLAELVALDPAPDRALVQEVLLLLADALGRPGKPWGRHERAYEFGDVLLGPAEWQPLHEQVCRLGFHL